MNSRVAGTFHRKPPKKKTAPTILVVCEDTKSSKTYIEDAASHYRIKVKVSVIHCGNTDPLGIVRFACDNSTKYEKIFCIVDRDNHPKWLDAEDLSKSKQNVEFIPTYPCFEYWLLLHFIKNRKPYQSEGKKSSGDCCVEDLKKQDGMEKYSKGGSSRIFDDLIKRLPSAIKNSIEVLADADSCNDYNPSSKMHELFRCFEELEKDLD